MCKPAARISEFKGLLVVGFYSSLSHQAQTGPILTSCKSLTHSWGSLAPLPPNQRGPRSYVMQWNWTSSASNLSSLSCSAPLRWIQPSYELTQWVCKGNWVCRSRSQSILVPYLPNLLACLAYWARLACLCFACISRALLWPTNKNPFLVAVQGCCWKLFSVSVILCLCYYNLLFTCLLCRL